MPKYNYKKAFLGKRNRKTATKLYSRALTTAIRASPYSGVLSTARKYANKLGKSYARYRRSRR